MDRKVWNQQEDDAIIQCIEELGIKKWSIIAEKMKSKFLNNSFSGKQCRQRWHNHLNPDINKNSWTKEQELLLLQKQEIFGNKWTKISKIFQGRQFTKTRTDNSVKNHFYSTLRRVVRWYNREMKIYRMSKKQIKLTTLNKIINLSNKRANNKQNQLISLSKNLKQQLFKLGIQYKKYNCDISQYKSKIFQIMQIYLDFDKEYRNLKKTEKQIIHSFSNFEKQLQSDQQIQQIVPVYFPIICQLPYSFLSQFLKK